ncbi:MAG: LuxR C-terminal-related transcriptional regulator [Candidatus Flexifilum sp.]|jgi:DNA-binding NarL/FixJ family response regulator
MTSETLFEAAPRALVVAASPLARAGLSALLRAQGLDVVAQVADDPDLGDELDIFRPEVIIWEMGYDPARCYERLSDVQTAGIPVIALIAGTPEAAACAPALLARGVRAILLDDADASAMTAAVDAVSRGLVALDQAAVDALIANALPATTGEPASDPLTARELEVLRLIAEGLPNKQIALNLSISEHTVKFHVNSILTKLGAQSRTEAVVRATRLGWIAL